MAGGGNPYRNEHGEYTDKSGHNKAMQRAALAGNFIIYQKLKDILGEQEAKHILKDHRPVKKKIVDLLSHGTDAQKELHKLEAGAADLRMRYSDFLNGERGDISGIQANDYLTNLAVTKQKIIDTEARVEWLEKFGLNEPTYGELDDKTTELQKLKASIPWNHRLTKREKKMINSDVAQSVKEYNARRTEQDAKAHGNILGLVGLDSEYEAKVTSELARVKQAVTAYKHDYSTQGAENREGEAEFAASYNPYKYTQIPYGTTGDTVALTLDKETGKLQVLLIQRKKPPYEGYYAEPGGFVEGQEDGVLGAQRELLEETNVRLTVDKFISSGYYFSEKRDPRMPIGTFGFVTVIPNLATQFRAGDDAETAQLVDVDKLFTPNSKYPLAFDHKRIIRDALLRLTK